MIFKRKIYEELLQWKRTDEGRTAVLIQGARRVGKSTIAEKFAANENFWYNKVIEIEGMSLNVKDRSVRHGHFKCFRDDKNPTDCKLNELF